MNHLPPSHEKCFRATRRLVVVTITLSKQELGGKVIYFGKPYKAHFEAAQRLLGVDAVHVGDSFYHDVKGARDAGLPVVFVAGGIEHKDRPLDRPREKQRNI